MKEPAVPVGRARYRLQVMAAHSDDQAICAANAICDAIEEAEALMAAQPQARVA